MNTERYSFLEKLLATRYKDCAIWMPALGEVKEISSWTEIPIEHSSFLNAAARIAAAHLKFVRRKRGECMYVIGESGAGKTSLISWYLARNPIEPRSDFDQFPVLVVQTPSKPTIKNLAEAVLRALGAPMIRETETEKTNRILELLVRHGVELIFIDEFQHFVDRRSAATLEVTDWLKALVDASKRAVVLVGLPRSEIIVRQNEQLRRRFAKRCELLPFSNSTESSWLEFRAVLRELHRRSPVPAEDFHEPDLARRFMNASEGLISYLVTIVSGAIDIASRTNRRIDREILAAAFEEEVWPGVPDDLNPFLADGDLRPLRGGGEPFELWGTRQ
jgi:type II secretory pathway predicted ATPase ExeA